MDSRHVAQMKINTIMIIGEQALLAPPTDELSEVRPAYQSGEQQDDRPASALAGVQPVLSSFEGVGVGADNHLDACTVRAWLVRSLLCLRVPAAQARRCTMPMCSCSCDCAERESLGGRIDDNERGISGGVE